MIKAHWQWSSCAWCLLLWFAGCDRSTPATICAPTQRRPPVPAAQTKPSEALGQASRELAGEELTLEEPASYKPLVARAALFPAEVQAPGTWTLLVRAKTAPGWHIYAAGQPAGTAQPTRLDLQLPDGVEAEGDWIYPEATKGNVASDGQSVYEGDFTFRCRLKVSEKAPLGRLKVGCEIHYQACDRFSCRPPESLTLEAAADVVQNP
jgi:DsbC/DsbD-like thiol-disulfide interchange protein